MDLHKEDLIRIGKMVLTLLLNFFTNEQIIMWHRIHKPVPVNLEY